MLIDGVGFKISEIQPEGKNRKDPGSVLRRLEVAVAPHFYALPLEYRQASVILPLSPIASAAPAFTADLAGDFGFLPVQSIYHCNQYCTDHGNLRYFDTHMYNFWLQKGDNEIITKEKINTYPPL